MKTKKEVEEEFKFFLKTLLDNYNAKLSIEVDQTDETAAVNLVVEIPEREGISEYCYFELPKTQKFSWEDAVINL